MSDPLVRADFRVPAEDRRRGLVPSRARRLPSARGIARRRVLVRLAKLALPLLAAGLFTLIVFWPDIEGREGRLSFRRGPALVPEALQVVAPHYQGLDEQNRPYTVTAQLARMPSMAPGEAEIVLLTEPTADILLGEGAWIYAESRAGRYDRGAQLLDLEGDVTIFHDNGAMFRTEQAPVRLQDGHASGERATMAQGPFGTVHAEGFELIDRGAVVIFTGRAHAVLEGRQQ
jgi:lipopolysaccharide export system protein LptC